MIFRTSKNHLFSKNVSQVLVVFTDLFQEASDIEHLFFSHINCFMYYIPTTFIGDIHLLFTIFKGTTNVQHLILLQSINCLSVPGNKSKASALSKLRRRLMT